MKLTATFLVIAFLGTARGQEFGGHALFVRTSPAAGKGDTEGLSESEPIVRQQSEGYLPPYSTQRPPEKPRPFQAPSTAQQPTFAPPILNEVTPQRPSTLYTPPTGGFGTSAPTSQQAPPFSTTRPGFTASSAQPSFGTSPTITPRPTTAPPFSTPTSSPIPSIGSTGGSSSYLPPLTGFSSTTPRPLPTTQAPFSPSGYSSPSGFSSPTGFSGSTGFSPSTGYSSSTGFSPSSGYPSPSGFSGSSRQPSSAGISSTYGYSTQRPSTFGSSSTYGSPSTYGSSSVGSSVGSTGGYSTPGGFSSTYGYSTTRPTTSFTTPSGGSSTGYASPGGFSTYGYSTQRPTVGYSGSTGGSTFIGSTIKVGYPSTTPYPKFSTPGTSGTTRGPVKVGGPIGTAAATGVTMEKGTGPGAMGNATDEDDDLKHPPHIHSLDVECSKTMMTINIEFNRAFDGVIYSKGYFMTPECRYIEENSGQTKYSFTVSLDSCGTQFINDFEGEAGQAYLENVLVLQNEPGIQEVWDTIRRVRCLWEGNINKALSVNFSVDMLNQETVTFSGDTATAKLDIQIGRGPFASAADGLVKIGETMTLVVSVEGDPAFDLQVRDCLARDDTSTNVVQLTDERGCILKPKLFGAFQKTNDTGNTGASIIAYAFFQAFKFPDVMDLFIECNVELCKTDCQPCPEEDQQIEPGRRRRSVTYAPWNDTGFFQSDPVRVARGIKVIMLDDLSTSSSQALEQLEEEYEAESAHTRNVCMSHGSFYAAFTLMLGTVILTTLVAAISCAKLRRVYRTKSFSS